MDTMVVWSPEFTFDVGVARAASAAKAIELVKDRYDLIDESLSACALRDFPESRLSDALVFAVMNVRGFIPTVDLREVTRSLTAHQVYQELENLASWLDECNRPHPWLRSRTEYDDRADAEARHWLSEVRADEVDLDSERRAVMRAVRKEVTDRYEVARLAGLPVPDTYLTPPSLTAYREQRRPLFERLRDHKADGQAIVMTREVLLTLLDKEGRTLFETAQLFGTSIRDICEMLPDERRGRGRRPVQARPRDVSDRFEQFVYEVNLESASEQVQAVNVEEVYVIPVAKRHNALFSIYRSNHGLDAGRAFERLLDEMSQLQLMFIHQLGPSSGWNPQEAAMMELIKRESVDRFERVKLRGVVGELELAIKLLQNEIRRGEDGAESTRYDRVLKALSDAVVNLNDQGIEN